MGMNEAWENDSLPGSIGEAICADPRAMHRTLPELPERDLVVLKTTVQMSDAGKAHTVDCLLAVRNQGDPRVQVGAYHRGDAAISLRPATQQEAALAALDESLLGAFSLEGCSRLRAAYRAAWIKAAA